MIVLMIDMKCIVLLYNIVRSWPAYPPSTILYPYATQRMHPLSLPSLCLKALRTWVVCKTSSVKVRVIMCCFQSLCPQRLCPYPRPKHCGSREVVCYCVESESTWFYMCCVNHYVYYRVLRFWVPVMIHHCLPHSAMCRCACNPIRHTLGK